MKIKKNKHSKISSDVLAQCFALYANSGWKLLWIAKKFNIYHTTLFYHILKKGIIRNVPVLLTRPAEVAVIYKQRVQTVEHKRKKRTVAEHSEEDEEFNLIEKTYSQILKEDSLRRKEDTPDTECSHAYWIKKCSICSAILESDVQVNQFSSKNPVRFVYNEFDKIVCSYDSALELQQLGVYQHSMLYWIYYDNKNLLTLRVKSNLPTASDDNAAATSAFTSQELFQHLLKLPPIMRDASFMNKLALNGSNPTYLAKLLARCLRKFEKHYSSKRKAMLQTAAKVSQKPADDEQLSVT